MRVGYGLTSNLTQIIHTQNTLSKRINVSLIYNLTFSACDIALRELWLWSESTSATPSTGSSSSELVIDVDTTWTADEEHILLGSSS